MKCLKLLISSILMFDLFQTAIQMGPCPSDYKGSTPEIESIFIGRCSYFVNILHKDDCDIQNANINCKAMWSEFSQAVLNKDPCNVSISSFDKLFELSSHPIRPNTTLFWSGTNNLAHESILCYLVLSYRYKWNSIIW